MADLLDAVQALTEPVRRKIIQDNPEGPEPTKVVNIQDPPLLTQLDEAIRSNMGGTTLGASDPATRSLINAAALMKLMQISSQVMGWARSAGSVVDKQSMTTTLKGWHIKFTEYAKSDEVETAHIKQLGAWAGQIEAILDPPRELDLPYNCPLCGSDCWWNAETKQSFSRPLVIRYRPAESGVVRDATGLCRACRKVWSARELQFEIEQMEAEKEAS